MLFYVLYFFIVFHYLCKHIDSDVVLCFIFLYHFSLLV